jgi:Tfp pilus assembly protein PilF
MRNDLQTARQFFEQHEHGQALEILKLILEENGSDIEALLLRARIQYKMQHWGYAMNDYALVLEYDPENVDAKSGLEMVKSILGYFNPDMFNP